MKKNFDVLLTPEAVKFIKSLDIKAQQKVTYNIQKSRVVNDTKILKKINNELWEYRIRFNQQQIRLMAFWHPDKKALIICTHGFVKKSQKIPKSEMQKAHKIRANYLNKEQ